MRVKFLAQEDKSMTLYNAGLFNVESYVLNHCQWLYRVLRKPGAWQKSLSSSPWCAGYS